MSTAHEPHRSGVIVVGSVNADMTTFSDRLPQQGETIHGNDFALGLGGKGANQVVAARRAGAEASFVGCVGTDLFRDLVTTGLAEADVDVSHLRTVPGSTGVAHIRVDGSGNNNIVVIPLANGALTAEHAEEAIEALAPRSAVLLTQLEIPLEAAVHSVRTAHRLGVQVVLDPAPALELPDDIWSSVDVVTPNETEATAITGHAVIDAASAVTAGEWFLQRGARAALITLAGTGSILVTVDGAQTFSPFSVTAVDTTAAGDTFAGYLAAGLAEGLELPEAIELANAAGALAVTVRGATPSIPVRENVMSLIHEQRPSRAN